MAQVVYERVVSGLSVGGSDVPWNEDYIATLQAPGARPVFEGYATRNVLASYVHLHFGSNKAFPKHLVERCAEAGAEPATKAREAAETCIEQMQIEEREGAVQRQRQATTPEGNVDWSKQNPPNPPSAHSHGETGRGDAHAGSNGVKQHAHSPQLSQTGESANMALPSQGWDRNFPQQTPCQGWDSVTVKSMPRSSSPRLGSPRLGSPLGGSPRCVPRFRLS